MNPHALAQRQRAQQITSLQEENEKLKKRLQILEESGGGQVRTFLLGNIFLPKI